MGPRSCYEEGKRFGEAFCKAYRDEYGVDVRIARIFVFLSAQFLPSTFPVEVEERIYAWMICFFSGAVGLGER